MHAFDVLGDPVRRRILELLAAGEQTSGAVTAVVRAEFGISQPAVSQHLQVLREHGFAAVRPAGTRRLYAVRPEPLRRSTPGSTVPPVLDAAPRRAGHRAGPRPRERAAPRREDRS